MKRYTPLNLTQGQFKYLILICLIIAIPCRGLSQHVDADKQIRYCLSQARKSLAVLPATGKNLPRTIENGEHEWKMISYNDWCSGFWPGILGYLYGVDHDLALKQAADKFTMELEPVVNNKGFDHDLGFMIYDSFGKGYQYTKNRVYKTVVLKAADSLAMLFNPKVGTILSWPKMVKKMGWPHNTIIDNMINLELLFWTSKNGGSKHLYDIAVTHAETTMKNHFRPDYTSYHVVVYDTVSGKKIKGVTHQGYADNSMWARGQSWAIYGFTMCYRETRKPEFLDFAQKVADVYLKNLPKDLVPYWDFNDPAIPNAPRDASAAGVTASGLLELSTLIKNPARAKYYRSKAEQMLASLSTPQYQSGDRNPAFLMHSTGHHPNGTEIDASIIYADYYYLEALVRLKALQKKH